MSLRLSCLNSNRLPMSKKIHISSLSVPRLSRQLDARKFVDWGSERGPILALPLVGLKAESIKWESLVKKLISQISTTSLVEGSLIGLPLFGCYRSERPRPKLGFRPQDTTTIVLHLIFWNASETINAPDAGFLLIFRRTLNLGHSVVCHTPDGGSEWKEGRRVSTRIKSRPLNWWRGEKMLYGRIHSSTFVNRTNSIFYDLKTLVVVLIAKKSQYSIEEDFIKNSLSRLEFFFDTCLTESSLHHITCFINKKLECSRINNLFINLFYIHVSSECNSNSMCI